MTDEQLKRLADQGMCHPASIDTIEQAGEAIVYLMGLRDGLIEERDEESAIREKLATLLAETAVALKGPEAALFRHSWHDLAEVATGVVKQRDSFRDAAEYNKRRAEDAEKQRDELLAALEKMNRAYVGLMENGRDRIIMLRGDCDPVDVMERSDPHLRESRAAIASVKESK